MTPRRKQMLPPDSDTKPDWRRLKREGRQRLTEAARHFVRRWLQERIGKLDPLIATVAKVMVMPGVVGWEKSHVYYLAARDYLRFELIQLDSPQGRKEFRRFASSLDTTG